ncbi:MAG: T9SS type A sorting domain-containing protein [Calditrichaeota bacterium]|nr:T9SS type A sorting domain-containing protein [Calditrichota bacterium]MCB9369938.1 T9SS type A sorting domain-containing protein [Calditrichota bacterium]
MTLSTNSGTGGTSGFIQGYLGQPIVGYFGTTSSGAVMHSGYVRVLQQFLLRPSATPQQPAEVPLNFGLEQNYPNPFNPSTVIPFSLDKAGAGELTIFNLLGQQVRSYDLSDLAPGLHHITWDGLAQNGATLPSGEYFARLSHSSRVQVRKLTLLK